MHEQTSKQAHDIPEKDEEKEEKEKRKKETMRTTTYRLCLLLERIEALPDGKRLFVGVLVGLTGLRTKSLSKDESLNGTLDCGDKEAPIQSPEKSRKTVSAKFTEQERCGTGRRGENRGGRVGLKRTMSSPLTRPLGGSILLDVGQEIDLPSLLSSLLREPRVCKHLLGRHSLRRVNRQASSDKVARDLRDALPARHRDKDTSVKVRAKGVPRRALSTQGSSRQSKTNRQGT